MPTVSISIDVPNLATATHFYESALGCKKLRDQGASMAVLTAGNIDIYLLEKEDGTNAINDSANPERNAARSYHRHWTPIHLDFAAQDVPAAVAKVLAAGGSHEGGQTGDWGAIAHCADPFGNGFCLIKE